MIVAYAAFVYQLIVNLQRTTCEQTLHNSQHMNNC